MSRRHLAILSSKKSTNNLALPTLVIAAMLGCTLWEVGFYLFATQASTMLRLAGGLFCLFGLYAAVKIPLLLINRYSKINVSIKRERFSRPKRRYGLIMWTSWLFFGGLLLFVGLVIWLSYWLWLGILAIWVAVAVAMIGDWAEKARNAKVDHLAAKG